MVGQATQGDFRNGLRSLLFFFRCLGEDNGGFQPRKQKRKQQRKYKMIGFSSSKPSPGTCSLLYGLTTVSFEKIAGTPKNKQYPGQVVHKKHVFYIVF